MTRCQHLTHAPPFHSGRPGCAPYTSGPGAQRRFFHRTFLELPIREHGAAGRVTLGSIRSQAARNRGHPLVEKARDVAGLYPNPPEHAPVVCVTEEPQIQATDLHPTGFSAVCSVASWPPTSSPRRRG